MRFEFATAGRIVFEDGGLRHIGSLATGLGRRAFVLSGVPAHLAETLLGLLAASGLAATVCGVPGEPTIEAALEALEQARRFEADLLIGFGGGSAMDGAKAVAALLTNPGDPLDYLEVVGKGLPLRNPSLPVIAIPTTAGTGSEVTRNAVLGVKAQGVKVSLRSASMLPRLALVDPLLTVGLPPAVTASTGMDALTQVIEPLVCAQANPLSDAACREGIPRAARSLRQAYQHGDDVDARQDMALASLCGGLALANARLGAVHGFAAPLGGMFPAPHGAVCARLLPVVMGVNVRALQARAPQHPALARYTEIARLVTGNAAARPEDGVEWAAALCRDLAIPPLAAYGLTPAHFAGLAQKAATASSMQGNPIRLTEGELFEIMEGSLG
jgi:alcohol dehydrogenase class IV